MRFVTVVAAALLAASFSVSAFADEGLIKARQSHFKAVGGHMGAMAAIVKGEHADKGQLVGHARAMHHLARHTMGTGLWKQGTHNGNHKTRALPAIWQDIKKFEKIVADWVKHSEAAVKAAEAKDMNAFKKAFGAMGKNACKACHTDFRAKKS